jgi:hypothetical protein
MSKCFLTIKFIRYIDHAVFFSGTLRNIYNVNKLEWVAALCLLSSWYDLGPVLPAKLL